MFKDRKLLLRLLGFIAAVIVAVVAFTQGILHIGHKDPGYYDVGLTAEANAALYGAGAHLLVYAEGSSSEIRQLLTARQKTFSQALLAAYRLLDAEHTYDGVVNIASLNQQPGQSLAVDDALYQVLCDAQARYALGQGYTPFAGPLYREWQTLRYLNDPLAQDPSNNAQEAALLGNLTALIARPDAAALDLSVPGHAMLTVSPAYAAFLADEELEGPVLDLSLLHDAWLLTLTARVLRDQGLAGYLYTDSGCSLWLDSGDTRYTLYGEAGDALAAIGTLAWASPSAYCQFTALPPDAEQPGYYSIDGLRRHPLIDPRSGLPAGLVRTAAVAGDADSLVDIAYELAMLCLAEDQAALAGRLPQAAGFFAYTLADSPQTLYLPAGFDDRVTLEEGVTPVPLDL